MKTAFEKWHRPWLIGTLALALSLSALAGESRESGQPGSLAGVVAQAWRLHPQAAGLDARDAEARAAEDLAGGLTPEPPSVSISNLNDRQGRNLGKQEWEVELALPLWLSGQKEARTREAESRLVEAAAQRVAVRLELAGEVREAWWALAATRSALALATRRSATARALAADVHKRFKVGELSRIDANLAQAEVLAADDGLIEAQASLLQAEQTFALLTGIAAPAALSEEAASNLATRQETLADAASAALHPQVAALAASARSAWTRVKLAEETRRAAPELSFRVQRERADFADFYGSSVGVRLKIPFSSGAQVRRNTSAATAEAAQADAEMHRAQRRVEQEIERARRALDAVERQLGLAVERRTLTADSLRLAEKSFALGESDLATLLRLRAAALEGESFHERQRIARAAALSRLNQSLGVMP